MASRSIVLLLSVATAASAVVRLPAQSATGDELGARIESMHATLTVRAQAVTDDEERLAHGTAWFNEESLQFPALAAVDTHEARLAAFKAAGPASSCEPNESERLVADVAVWAIGQQREIEIDAREGRASVAACRMTDAASAVQSLKESRDQLVEMTTAFGAMSGADGPTVAPPSPVLDLAQWISSLDTDRGRLGPGTAFGERVKQFDNDRVSARRHRQEFMADWTDLVSGATTEALAKARASMPDVERLAALADRIMPSDLGPDSEAARLVASFNSHVARLGSIVADALPLVQRAMACELTSQGALVAARIADMALMADRQTRDLESASNDATRSCSSAARADVPRAAAGPSWLPPPAIVAGAGAPKHALPLWVPTQDSPSAQPPVRAADVVDQTRAQLITEEQQRITDQSRVNAEARAQRTDKAAQDQRDSAAHASASAQQAQALDQQRLAAQQQRLAAEQRRRAQRRTSFIGLIGRVTAAVATTAFFPPAGIAALIPTIRSLASGAGAGKVMLPQIPGVSSTVQAAAEQALSAATGGKISASPIGSVSALPGAAPAAPGSGSPDPYAGLWQCTLSTTTTGVDGKRTSGTTQAQIGILGGNGSYVLKSGQGDMPGRLSGHQLVFQQAALVGGLSCQQQAQFQLQGATLSGTESAGCSDHTTIDATAQCHR